MLCALVGRFARERGWKRLGYARAGDYAAERLGTSARTLQDYAHVEAALRELRGLEVALVSGSLGWTKVRLLARVATPADEAEWLALARRLSARELAREVRAIDLGARAQPGSAEADVEGSEDGPREAVGLLGSHRTRVEWRQCHQLARRVSGESAPLWQAMEWVAAEVLSSLPLESAIAPTCPEVLLPPRCRPLAVMPAQEAATECVELNADLAKLLDGLDDADAFTLDRRLRAAVALDQKQEASVAPLALRVFEGRLFRECGYGRFEDYAIDRLGMSARRGRMLLRLARAARRCPELAFAWRSGRLSWTKAHELVPVVSLGDAAGWVRWAERVTVRRLREDVSGAVDRADPAPPNSERQTGAEPRAPESTSRFYFSAPAVVARLFRATVCHLRRHLEREWGRPVSEDDALQVMFAHFRDVWDARRVPKRHAVFQRDGWRCTVPGCSSYRNLHEHHIVYRSRGGSDESSNRTTLCAWHHLRGQHAGRIRVTGSAPGGLRFELGLRDGQPALARYDAQDKLL